MKTRIRNFSKYLIALAFAAGVTAPACAESAPNARAATTAPAARAANRAIVRTDAAVSHSARNTTNDVARGTTTRRTADASVASRTATRTPAAGRAATTRRTVSGALSNRAASATTRTARTATATTLRPGAGRSATTPGRSAARSATIGASRAGVARATAVFNDISKIGGGYAACRESYATCMDQFCAAANDTYRRCFCSDRFTEFRDTELAMDQAMAMLTGFENNNLNVVNMTPAEVEAMYSATIGEEAMKQDVSAASQKLAGISAVLSGQKVDSNGFPASSKADDDDAMDFDIEDVWGASDAGIFATNEASAPSLSELEGAALYSRVYENCAAMAQDACGENPMTFNMAKSSYEILIAQDCNLYEKKVDSKKSKVEQAVRQAEKLLRDARLEDYRAHNSQDVNDCINKVRAAIQMDTACGPNYQRCLDYTGRFINQTTGDPIYSKDLFNLKDLINLNFEDDTSYSPNRTKRGQDATITVLEKNPDFNSFLESRKMFATGALDSCRDIEDTVWTEFKRAALIEISQAQDEKIEEVKMSCVSTMKECYDTQTGALKSFDDTTAKTAGALSVYAAKAMCQEKVEACSSLYGGGENGLKALNAFVDSVDNERVGEACGAAVENYLKDLCTSGTEYPWGCRNLSVGEQDTKTSGTIWGLVDAFVNANCKDPTNDTAELPFAVTREIETIVDGVQAELTNQMVTKCEELDGVWVYSDVETNSATRNQQELKKFYTTNDIKKANTHKETLGYCAENTVMVRCLQNNSSSENGGDMATYDAGTDTCNFTDEWYESRCESLDGYWDGTTCYIEKL